MACNPMKKKMDKRQTISDDDDDEKGCVKQDKLNFQILFWG